MLVFHLVNTTDKDMDTFFKMLLYFIGLTTLWTKTNCSTTEKPDPCITASPFPHVQNRSTTYNKTFNINDRFITPGWYGTRGLSIPHTPPEYKHCGTKYPIYLKDRPLHNTTQIQTIGTYIRRSADVYNVTGPGINVKVCSPFLLVFKLVRTGVEQTGYCIGTLEGGDIPDFKTAPTVTYDQDVVASEAQFRFSCNFPEPTNDVLFYQAHWYVNNRFIYSSPLAAYADPANERVLTEAKLREQRVVTVGFDIYCEIRAGRGVNGPAGIPSTSKPIFIGIEVLTPTITVTEGKSGEIRIKATAKIGCPDSDCTYGVIANIPIGTDTCSPTVRSDTACGVKINPDKWEQIYSIKVTGSITEGEYRQQTNVMKITLRSPVQYFGHPIWGNYTLAPVTVNVIKDTKAIEGRKCVVSGDPHVVTFGNRHVELQIPGTFTMYRNDDYNNIEVQVRSHACTGGRFEDYFCACGIVVRVGQTVFMINHCSIDYWVIDYILCNDGGDILDVKKLNSGGYKIMLPTGAYLEIKFWYTALNIFMYPSVIDVGVSRGLCGSLSGLDYSQQNELVLRSGSTTTDDTSFLNSWKTPVVEDMFDPDNLGRLNAWSRNYTTCKCNEVRDGVVKNEIDCSPYNEPVICNEDVEFRTVHKKRCISPSRKKRSIPTIRNRPENHRRIKRDVSWKNGWTNESATEYCENLFKSSNMVNLCKEVPGVDVSFPMANCVLDIQLSGTTNFSLTAINSIRSQCLREASMNVTLRQETSPDKPSVLKMVKAVACPAECSDRGVCVNGTCDCNDGYSGPDCSVDLTQPPLADSLEANGYCDRKDGSCEEIAIFGGPFVESDKFKCRLMPLESNAEAEITNAPVVESIGEVTCPLPVNRQKRSTTVPVVDTTVPSYRVAVSNDGQLFSRQLTVVVMDSNCMDCTIDGETVTCRMFDDYCYTDERCYKTGEKYIYNEDYQCTNGQWQTIKSTPDDKVPAIVGGVVGTALLICILIIIILVIYRNSCKRSRTPTDQVNEHTYDSTIGGGPVVVYDTLKTTEQTCYDNMGNTNTIGTRI
ncbi:von Willebrand factor D and EGF domain-containing protein-like [Patella vulgata]|uniref:von Willebrand factor D and EGF domain-containing protein-like n=1 Tax=Patella vulgata TaxID=6465 RepID=UPI0024A89605|nr:von Willebrand factor D and EGF domain-containing protein-like [Patella vulgata]